MDLLCRKIQTIPKEKLVSNSKDWGLTTCCSIITCTCGNQNSNYDQDIWNCKRMVLICSSKGKNEVMMNQYCHCSKIQKTISLYLFIYVGLAIQIIQRQHGTLVINFLNTLFTNRFRSVSSKSVRLGLPLTLLIKLQTVCYTLLIGVFSRL